MKIWVRLKVYSTGPRTVALLPCETLLARHLPPGPDEWHCREEMSKEQICSQGVECRKGTAGTGIQYGHGHSDLLTGAGHALGLGLQQIGEVGTVPLFHFPASAHRCQLRVLPPQHPAYQEVKAVSPPH